MAIYILLSRLSQQGVATLKSNPDRLREVNRDVEELGAKVLHQWATLGEFDFISVVEAPDTATVARVSVALAARGSTRVETLPALTIAQLYKSRWQIELFFKWIKQHLRIKAFYGTSENAVKTQIWIAVAVYVLVAIVRKKLGLEASLYQILQILSVTLFGKMPILQALQASDCQDNL